MKLSVLFGRAGLEYPPELGDLDITKIVTDSREAAPGCLFLCIKGRHSDGHGFVNDAIKAGAAIIVAEQVRDACVGGAAAYIMLENTRRVAALLYNAWYGNPVKKMKIIGVTGTNGKTSVCFLLTELFRAAGFRCGLVGTVCCQSADGRALSPLRSDSLANMTTPDPEELYRLLAKMAEDRVEYVFMEVTSHALALHKTDAIFFDTAIFTNLTQDHLDFHETMEEYFSAKRRLFSQCRRAVINADDAAGRRLLAEVRCPTVTCSVTEGEYCALSRKSLGLSGSVYRLKTPTESFEITLGIPGGFSVMNSLEAAAVALSYGISPETVQRVLRTTAGVTGRMERLRIDGAPFSVLIDYAHTPDALEKLLRSVWEIRRSGERIVLLFGCGGDRDRSKRREMARIASRYADFTIVTADNSRSEDPEQIFSDILKGLDKEKPYTVIRDRRAAIFFAVRSARPGDILILAGKGHETYEIDAEGRHPFDERRIVKEAFADGNAEK